METWKLLTSGPRRVAAERLEARRRGPEPLIGDREKAAGHEWRSVKRMCVAFGGPTARRSQPRAQALGFCDNAPSCSRPRSERAQERRRTGLHYAWPALPAGHTLLRPFRARSLRKKVGMRRFPGQHSPRLGPPWADSFAPLALRQVSRACRKMPGV